MGIDIYARWENQTQEEEAAQQTGYAEFAGRYGHLRENYPAWPCVTRYLVREAFSEIDNGTIIESGAFIPAATLRARLPIALGLMQNKLRRQYPSATSKDFKPFFSDLIAFVAICECLEKKIGKPVNILAAI